MEWSILFMGPVGAGKTQAIQSISEIEVVNTDMRATDETSQIKSHTTVAMDVGVINVSTQDKVRLYGAPGQDRFDFMWDILLTQCKGIILLINHNRPTPLVVLDHYIKAITERTDVKKMPLVIGITHVDDNHQLSTDIYAEHIQKKSILFNEVVPPVFVVDMRERTDVRSLLLVMVAQLEMAVYFPKVANRSILR